MNIRTNFLFLFLFFTGFVPINRLFGQNSFELIHSTPNDEEIFDGILHSSGNIYLSGRTRLYSTTNYYPLILKIDEEGEMESVEWINPDTIGFFPQLIELDNGNIMLIGQCGLSSGNETNKRWIRIIDPEINIVSDHFFSQDTSYYFVFQNNVVKDYSGDIVVLGAVEFDDFNPGNWTTDFFIAKYSQDGDSLDFQIFPFNNHIEEVYDLSCIPGTDQYLAITSAFFIGMPSPQIVRISYDLTLISNIWFNDPNCHIDSPCIMDPWLNDSTFLLSGLNITDEISDDENQIGISKADINANIFKFIALGKPDTIDYPAWFNNLGYINDTTIYVGGFMNYIAFWPTEPSFIELYMIDTNLNVLGYRQFGGDINYRLFGITTTSDGGCLMYSSTYSDSNLYHEHDVHIFKVPRDSIEIITQIVDVAFEEKMELSAYPNPVNDILNIPLQNSIENIHIQLYKVDGKKVYDAEISGSGNLIKLNVRHLPPGLYVYTMNCDSQSVASGKFIKN